MRKRLVMSTLIVVVTVMVTLLAPVLLVVNAASDVANTADLYMRIGVIALFALLAAGALAWLQARRVAEPLERLARSAGRVGDGDFSAPTVSTGVEEIDAISRSLRLSANRVERMLESERSFTADATHQLRTGLTGLAIRLELLERHSDPEVSAEANAVLEQTHELNSTLDELLAVARTGSTGERAEVELTEIVNDHIGDWRARWDGRGRQIVVTLGRTEPVRATPGLVGQVVNVLVENALKHGSGTLAIMVNGTSVILEDDGSGIRDDVLPSLFKRPADHHAAHGRGLALARRLAESDGGRLELTRQRPAQFELSYLPAVKAEALAAPVAVGAAANS